ncbi:hypothetical protein ACF0H5_003252 [Mactra antiquata]
MEFCLNSSALIAEEATFSSLKLHPNQSLVEFHASIQDKGRRLQKSDRELISRFTDGLPQQLAFFALARGVTSFRECLHTAQTGEAHGYHNDAPNSFTTAAVDLGSSTYGFKPKAKQAKVCHKCNGAFHFKNTCNWSGCGEKSPKTKCQLCDQFGHTAISCMKNPKANIVKQPTSNQNARFVAVMNILPDPVLS